VWAALVLVRHWIAAGRPLGTKTLGSYERWAAVMGGILRAAGIPGFLGNLDALYDEADTEGAMWRELVDTWWDKYRDGEVGVAGLFTLAQASERFDFGRATTERGQKTAFGMALSKQRNRIIGRYQVQRAGTQRRAAQWKLVEVRRRVNLENHDEPFAAQSEIQEHHGTALNPRGGEKVHVGSQGSHDGTAGACLACGEGSGVDGRLCADCAAELEAATPSAGLFGMDTEPLPCARIRIHDDDYGRLYLKWYADDSAHWFEILDDFKATFRTHSERSYSSATRTWSVPLWCRRRLHEWASYWFDDDAQQWDEEELAGRTYGSRTYSRSGYGQYSRPQGNTSAVDAAYAHLCLTPDAPAELLKTVHHWWVRALHPATDHGDTARMASVNAAVDVIREDQERRAS
jgi:hypothetical protein